MGPPTGRRAVGHRVRDVGSAGPFLKPAVPWPAARKTLSTVRQIRGPRRGPFVFLGASDLHPLTPFHPGAGPPAPCRLFLLSADVLGPSECAEGPSHLGEAGVALCSQGGGAVAVASDSRGRAVAPLLPVPRHRPDGCPHGCWPDWRE